MIAVGVLRGAWWWIRSVMGDLDYDRYVEHARRVHPDRAVLTKAQYWRERHADADANPGARCC